MHIHNTMDTYRYYYVGTCHFCRPKILKLLESGVVIDQLIGEKNYCDILDKHIGAVVIRAHLMAKRVKDTDRIKFTNTSRRLLIDVYGSGQPKNITKEN